MPIRPRKKAKRRSRLAICRKCGGRVRTKIGHCKRCKMKLP